MSVKFKQRFVTDEFAFAEVEADSFPEFVEATAAVADHLGHDRPAIDHDHAVQNLQAGGLVSAEAPGLSNQAPTPQYQQQPQAQAPQTDQYGNVIIGVDPVSNEQIKHGTGQYGPFVKAGKLYANVPKWHTGPVTLDLAVKWLQDKRAWNAQNGKG